MEKNHFEIGFHKHVHAYYRITFDLHPIYNMLLESSATPLFWIAIAKLAGFFDESNAWFNEQKRWLNLAWKKTFDWKWMKGQTQICQTWESCHSICIENSTTWIWCFNGIWKFKHMAKTKSILFFKAKAWQTFLIM